MDQSVRANISVRAGGIGISNRTRKWLYLGPYDIKNKTTLFRLTFKVEKRLSYFFDLGIKTQVIAILCVSVRKLLK